MPPQNTNVLYEPLYRGVLKENGRLNRKVKRLEDEMEKMRQRVVEAEEKVKQQEDANKKLRTMLFVKQYPKTRTKRHKEPKVRTAQSYARPKPERITDYQELALDHCPHCDTIVGDPVSSRTRIIEDIVIKPEPQVTEWTINRYWCRSCGKQVSGTVPGVLPKMRIGFNTLTFVILQKFRWNQPYDKIQEQLDICFGLTISQGEIANLITTAANLVGAKWHEITEAVKTGKIVHCDETGWYINGVKVWAHTFANDYAVLYEIAPTRGKKIAENRLQGFTGTRITDCLGNYKKLSGSHQICWAHLTREAQENAERDQGSKERAFLTPELDRIYADIRHVTTNWNKPEAERTERRCRQRVAQLQRRDWQDHRSRLLLNRLTDFKHALFTCLSAPDIPPDNNHAERVLRKLVVQRKISGGNRSPDHAEHHAKLMSVLETLRLESGSLLPNLQAVLRQGITASLSGG